MLKKALLLISAAAFVGCAAPAPKPNSPVVSAPTSKVKSVPAPPENAPVVKKPKKEPPREIETQTESKESPVGNAETVVAGDEELK